MNSQIWLRDYRWQTINPRAPNYPHSPTCCDQQFAFELSFLLDYASGLDGSVVVW